MNKPSILIIDDDEMDRYLLKRMISKADIASEVFEQANGKNAISFLSDIDTNRVLYQDDFPPLLIFLDINMPIMNGFEFLEEFSALRQQIPEHISSVFIMFTSSERDEDKEKSDAYEFVKGYVSKDKFSEEQLVEIVNRCQGLS